MTIVLFLFGVAVAAGLFFILADILKLPVSPRRRHSYPQGEPRKSG